MKRANQQRAKAPTSEVPVAEGVALLPPPLKRGRGRPRKNPMSSYDMPSCEESMSMADVKKPGKDLTGKALVTFRKAIADAEKANMMPSAFDGGGTAIDAHSVTKESLQRRVTRRLNVLDRFLTDDKLIELLAFSSLKEIGIYEGIMLDKSLVLQGQPNVIIGNDERASLRAMLPRLMSELKRRNLIASTSQTVEAL